MGETWEARLTALYESGVSLQAIARDPLVRTEFGAPGMKDATVAWRVWHYVKAQVAAEVLAPRAAPAPREPLSEADAEEGALYARHLAAYERLVGMAGRVDAPARPPGPVAEAVVFSDLHIPDERMDLVAEIARRHAGLPAYILGDLHDWANFSKYLSLTSEEGVVEVLARTEAALDVICRAFSHVTVLWGNHDWRPVKKAVGVLGPEFKFITEQFLLASYGRRPNLTIVRQPLAKASGRIIPDVRFFHALGDCVMGHVERSGARGRGAELAHDFFLSHRQALGLGEFRVVLQAHTHKQSYFRHRLTGAHLFEIGCLCETADYAIHTQRFDAIHNGYFFLAQQDGVTDLDRSRLYSF